MLFDLEFALKIKEIDFTVVLVVQNSRIGESGPKYLCNA